MSKTSSQGPWAGAASIPASAAASSKLGVRTSASGKNSLLSSCKPESSSRAAPEDEHSTGSTTILRNPNPLNVLATASATEAEPSIPTRTAAISRSSASTLKVLRNQAGVNWPHLKHALARLHSQSAWAGYGIAAVRCGCLDVRGDSSSRGGVKPGNAQHDRRHFHGMNVPQKGSPGVLICGPDGSRKTAVQGGDQAQIVLYYAFCKICDNANLNRFYDLQGLTPAGFGQ